jgi:hypothetical protein
MLRPKGRRRRRRRRRRIEFNNTIKKCINKYPLTQYSVHSSKNISTRGCCSRDSRASG